MRTLLIAVLSALFTITGFSQEPPIEPGVSQELAKWRAAHYSNVRYKLNLTLEKMSPVLRGTIEIRVNVTTPGAEARKFPNDATGAAMPPPSETAAGVPPIILDWRKIRGHEAKSIIRNVSINGRPLDGYRKEEYVDSGPGEKIFIEQAEHLLFRDGVVMGENVIKLDFTSPILASGSAITRYVDKEDGSEYIYSLFVPSDASTAFPVFDQPDLKARFQLSASVPTKWKMISNSAEEDYHGMHEGPDGKIARESFQFEETSRISTYVFAFAAGDFTEVRGERPKADSASSPDVKKDGLADRAVPLSRASATNIYVRKSQAAKFNPHSAEVFRLNREAIKYFEQYFDYKFPFPKYDLVLIPEFPFGGMEHAGATFLRESSIIFPQEPTKNDLVSRATLIFHEAAHQWFGDTVTMRWFDDLWLKEGFATFTAYKAMEKIMPEMNSWKVFYERIKQGAYQTDSTKGTTPIYQEIKNLSAAKSAYGNIVYNKAPAFLRQAEFYLGEEKFQTAVRAFLKKHEFANAGWEALVKEFEAAGKKDLKEWSKRWITQRGAPRVRSQVLSTGGCMTQEYVFEERNTWAMKLRTASENGYDDKHLTIYDVPLPSSNWETATRINPLDRILSRNVSEQICIEPTDSSNSLFFFPNYQDYGYGIFLLDEKSREYVLKNIQNEKDPFLRSMMWGSLWDSVREGELDPREYVELVVKVLSARENHPVAEAATPLLRKEGSQNTEDESTVASLLGRVGTAMNYYVSVPRAVATGPSSTSTTKSPVATALGSDLQIRLENLLNERMRNAETTGQRITYYRAFLSIASSEGAMRELRKLLFAQSTVRPPNGIHRSIEASIDPADRKPAKLVFGTPTTPFELKTKDKFDIITKLIASGYDQGVYMLEELEKIETSDDAKRYAYAARAAIPTAENKAKYWKDFTTNKEISESWIEAAFGPWNSIRHSNLTLPYLQKALQELPNHKRNRKIFFVNGWLGAFIGGQRSEEALNIVNKFLADNPSLDKDLRLKILENVDVIERAVKIRLKHDR